MHEDIFVHLVQIPGPINEAVSPCDGGYNVTIDPRQSHEGIIRSYNHALAHIRNNDFDKEDVQKIEAEAHEIKNEKIRVLKSKFR